MAIKATEEEDDRNNINPLNFCCRNTDFFLGGRVGGKRLTVWSTHEAASSLAYLAWNCYTKGVLWPQANWTHLELQTAQISYLFVLATWERRKQIKPRIQHATMNNFVQTCRAPQTLWSSFNDTMAGSEWKAPRAVCQEMKRNTSSKHQGIQKYS